MITRLQPQSIATELRRTCEVHRKRLEWIKKQRETLSIETMEFSIVLDNSKIGPMIVVGTKIGPNQVGMSVEPLTMADQNRVLVFNPGKDDEVLANVTKGFKEAPFISNVRFESRRVVLALLEAGLNAEIAGADESIRRLEASFFEE